MRLLALFLSLALVACSFPVERLSFREQLVRSVAVPCLDEALSETGGYSDSSVDVPDVYWKLVDDVILNERVDNLVWRFLMADYAIHGGIRQNTIDLAIASCVRNVWLVLM